MTADDAVRRLRRRLPSRFERRVTLALKVLAIVAVALYLLAGLLNFFAAVRVTGLLVVGAVFFAYLIGPFVRALNLRLPLLWSLAIVYLCVATVAAIVVALIAPPLGDDLQGFGRSLPGIVGKLQHELLAPTNPFVARIPADERLYLANLQQQLGALVQTYGLDTLQRSLAVVLSAVTLLSAAVVVPVLAAYVILDASEIKRHLLGLFPARRRGRVEGLLLDLDGVVGGFIRGQLIDGAIVGVMIFVMLSFTHVPYALLIGVAAGLLNFIPYAGAVVGFIPSVLLALAYNGPANAALVAALFAVIQQIDGNLVAPRVLKDSVGLSPVYIILAILAGTELFGLAGTFLAVPLAAMLRVLRDHLLPHHPDPELAP